MRYRAIACHQDTQNNTLKLLNNQQLTIKKHPPWLLSLLTRGMIVASMMGFTKSYDFLNSQLSKKIIGTWDILTEILINDKKIC